MENKKLNKKVIGYAAVAVVLVAALCALLLIPNCGKDKVSTETVTFTLTVSVDGVGEIYREEITANKGIALERIMLENITENGGVVMEESQYGAYITSICGYEQDYSKELYWSFYVNSEYAMEGVSSYCPQEGDDILFELAVSEW